MKKVTFLDIGLWLKAIAQGIVDTPESVEVAYKAGQNSVNYKITVADGEVRFVIGHGGATIHAIERLLITRQPQVDMYMSVEVIGTHTNRPTQSAKAVVPAKEVKS